MSVTLFLFTQPARASSADVHSGRVFKYTGTVSLKAHGPVRIASHQF